MRRAGRPGLIGLAARTAVVAGTANAVNSRAAAQQHSRAQAAAEQQQAQIDAAAQAAVQQQAPAAAATGGSDLVAELQKLAELKNAGILDDAEFTAAKAKLLS